MASSEARRFLSWLSDAFGVDGVLIVWKDPGGDGADLAPGDALKWPACQCGSPKCPDFEPSASSGDDLGARLAERNRRSSRGGV
nr:hypothetical protein OH820_12615 [Streptomyces sp. NBC_00857]